MTTKSEPDFAAALWQVLAEADEPCFVVAAALRDAAATITEIRDRTADAQKTCIVVIMQGASPTDWSEVEAATQLWAFVQWAALAWAQYGTRVNAVVLGQPPASPLQPRETAARAGFAAAAPPATPADIAAAVRLILSLPSMTGQMIRLGA